MRIGDVGTVSHVGDLLAFSMAVVLVLSLIYQVNIKAPEDEDQEDLDWPFIMMTLVDWRGFDPDGNGIIDIDGAQSRISSMDEPFPFDGEFRISFDLGSNMLEMEFIDGQLQNSAESGNTTGIIHSCSILANYSGSVLPGSMIVEIIGGIE